MYSKIFNEIWASLFCDFFFFFFFFFLLPFLPHSSMVTYSDSWRFFDDQQLLQTFNCCHRFSIGFKSGLIEGTDRNESFFWCYTVTDLDVCLRSLSCWKLSRWPQSRFLMIAVDFHPELSAVEYTDCFSAEG